MVTIIVVGSTQRNQFSTSILLDLVINTNVELEDDAANKILMIKSLHDDIISDNGLFVNSSHFISKMYSLLDLILI